MSESPTSRTGRQRQRLTASVTDLDVLQQRALLVGLVRSKGEVARGEASLEELALLTETAGSEPVESVLVRRERPTAATFVGSGKLQELVSLSKIEDIDVVVFDNDLTPAQQRNLQQAFQCDVVDRVALILDIFAQHAHTKEGMLQVELAQLRYRLPRLRGKGIELSRLGAGIGTRGPGETKLETDRRRILDRIRKIESLLKDAERSRNTRSKQRRRAGDPVVAIVGYTNAGKSSLFRRLAKADVLVEDRLFATLDPRARRASLGSDVTVVMTDTVGFIRKLPHDLVASFRSTLEEAVDADLVLHVVDVSHPSWEEHLRVGDEVLEGLGVDRERELIVLNKIDLVGGGRPLAPGGRRAVNVSAVSGEGLDDLRSAVRSTLLSGPGVAILRVPLDQAEMVQRAVNLPHQLARRYGDETVELAMRVDDWRLIESGLDGFRVAEWGQQGEWSE
jgi:GTP-binding protein HflX